MYDLSGYCENIGCYSMWEEMPLENLIMKNDMIRYIFKFHSGCSVTVAMMGQEWEMG